MGLFSISGTQSTYTTAPQETKQKYLVTQKVHDLLTAANVKLRRQNGMKKKEAELKAEEAFKRRFEIMSQEEENNRRFALFDSLKQANNNAPANLRLSESELWKIAYETDVSSVPEHMIDYAKEVLYGEPMRLW